MATWTSPITWTTGAVTASQFNQQIRDNESWIKGALTQLNVTSDSAKAKITPALVGARVFRSGNQTLTTGVATAITFDSERYDSDAFHSTSVNTSRITVPASMGGYYLVGGSVSFVGNSTGYRQATLVVNGVTSIASANIVGNLVSVDSNITLTTLALLAATDYVELVCSQNSGGGLAVQALSEYSPEFWIHRLSST